MSSTPSIGTSNTHRAGVIANEFFEAAKRFFVEGILSGKAAGELTFKAFSDNTQCVQHDFDQILDGDRFDDRGPESVNDRLRFKSQWGRFLLWAEQSELSVRWQAIQEGARTRWGLQVEPKAS